MKHLKLVEFCGNNIVDAEQNGGLAESNMGYGVYRLCRAGGLAGNG